MAKQMMVKTKAKDVSPDAKIVLRGKVSFCKVANPYIGESLEREIERIEKRNHKLGKNQNVPDSPFIRISLYDVECASTTDTTAFDYFKDNKMYKDENGSWVIRLEKNYDPKHPIRLCVKDASTGKYKNVPFTNDLASDQEIEIIITFFRAEKYHTNGWSISTFVLNSEPQWFSSEPSYVNTMRELGYDIDFSPLEDVSESAATFDDNHVDKDDFSPYESEDDVIDDVF